MSGLFSAISGQFTRTLVLGSLFPAAVFVLLWLCFVAPLLPPDAVFPVPPALGEEGGVLALTFVTLILAGLLYNLDIALMRLYEGYPWKSSLLGKWRTGVQRRRMEAERTRMAVLLELTAQEGIGGLAKLEQALADAGREFPLRFPDRPDLVLPTRLGNVLRAFERYPTVQYEIDAIYFWPRLVAVIPSAYAEAIDGARTSFVFLLNLSFLFAVLGVATLTAGLWYLPPGVGAHVVAPTIIFAGISWWLYGHLLRSALSWGETVKGAFDLYRWELLKQLGYRQTPRTRREERTLWESVTQQVIFGDAPVEGGGREPYVDYAAPSAPRTHAHGAEDDPALDVSRGVRRPTWDGHVRVVIRVENPDDERPATGVMVTDTLPEGTEYGWGSARVGGAAPRVTGTNPYRFHLPAPVPPGGSVELTYVAVRVDPGSGD